MPDDVTAATRRHEFRPWFGQALTIFVALVSVVSLSFFAVQLGAGTAVRALPFAVAATGACWALFWRPRVVIDLAGVQLVNVARTITLPWPSIRDVDTKWSLTLVTAYGRFTAWAAPAPGAAHAVRHRRDMKPMRAIDPSALSGELRPGDLPTSPSGEAALVIRQYWAGLKDAGHLDAPQLESERAPIEWHWRLGVAAVVVAAACVASLLV